MKNKTLNNNSEPIQENEHPTTLKEKTNYYWLSFHQNVLRNARVYTSIIILILFYMTSQFSKVYEELDALKGTIKEVSQSVITVTEDGRVIELTKQAIKPEEYAPVVATIIEKYLPRSRGNLLAPKYNNPNVPNATYLDWKELFSTHKGPSSLKEFYSNFIDEVQVEGQLNQGQTAYKTYLTKLVIGLRRETIPFTLDIIKSSFDHKTDWRVNGNEFTLKLKIKMTMAGVSSGGLKFQNRVTYGTYLVSGYIDIKHRTKLLNPFGIRFTNIETRPPKNPSQEELLRDAKKRAN